MVSSLKRGLFEVSFLRQTLGEVQDCTTLLAARKETIRILRKRK